MRARGGQEALVRWRRLSPSALILDLGGRGGEGWDVLRRLREETGSGLPPIILIAAPNDAHPAAEVDVAGVLHKPLDAETLLERLGAVQLR